MSDIDQKNTRNRVDTVQKCLEDIKLILEDHQDESGFIRNQGISEPDISGDVKRVESLSNLRDKLDEMHPADIAAMLEQLPLDERLIVWKFIPSELDGDVLLDLGSFEQALHAHAPKRSGALLHASVASAAATAGVTARPVRAWRSGWEPIQ